MGIIQGWTQLFGHLNSFKVVRNSDSPEEVEFIFSFEPNEYLHDDSLVLTKRFSNIQSPVAGSSITSVVTPIKWKAGKDLTKRVKGAPPSFFTWFAFEQTSESQDEFPESEDIAVELVDAIYPHAHKIFQDAYMEEDSDEEEDEDLGGISCHWWN